MDHLPFRYRKKNDHPYFTMWHRDSDAIKFLKVSERTRDPEDHWNRLTGTADIRAGIPQPAETAVQQGQPQTVMA